LWQEGKNRKKPAIFGQKALVFGKNTTIFICFFHPSDSAIPDCTARAAAAPRRRPLWRKRRKNNRLWAGLTRPAGPSVSRETERERSHNGTFSSSMKA
jgi:hypothetical protein